MYIYIKETNHSSLVMANDWNQDLKQIILMSRLKN